MSAYFDTGIITRWYVAEANSAAALALRRRHRPPCPLTHLHRLELLNAWRLKAFRGEIGEDVIALAAGDLASDIDAGVWQLPSYELGAVFATAEELSLRHSSRIGCRSLDILHVAAALELGVKAFITGDERQAKLATAEGLRVTRL